MRKSNLPEKKSYWGMILKEFLTNRSAVFFLCVMTALVLFVFLQPYLPGQRSPVMIYNDPATGIQFRNRTPDAEFWLGTNSIGQDLWARTWAGARTSLLIGFVTAGIEILLGTAAGLIWGDWKRFDLVFTEIHNLFSNVPRTLVLILLSYIRKPGAGTIILALSLTGWLGTARLVRNMVVILRDREYNIASRVLGSSAARIMVRNLLPYLTGICAMRAAFAIPAAIGNEVFVTYIGIGLPADMPSLGNLIQAGRLVMSEPALRYQLLLPVGIVSLITVSMYVIGNAFADASDPRRSV